ncbi:MmcQ/YjbR family DNA-binding protein [Methylobacterium sp. ID0610]|uniref:MmcQ/YjbR family DNA-binding protein n=1 Tax=Methylobacterium carpenticola TaxID=3344827 RepID=UPI0036BFE21A
MDGEVLQTTAMQVASALPDVTHTQPFGPGHEVFKVAGKMFMMTTAAPGEKIVTLKCDPDRALMLRDIYESISPGYHMNKRHWISIGAHGAITRDLIEDLVKDAYGLIIGRLPRARRPNGCIRDESR